MVNSLFRFSFHLWNTYFIWYLMFLNALEIKVFVKKKKSFHVVSAQNVKLFLFFYNSHSRTGVKYLNCLNTCSNKLLNITRYIWYVKNGVWPFFMALRNSKQLIIKMGSLFWLSLQPPEPVIVHTSKSTLTCKILQVHKWADDLMSR